MYRTHPKDSAQVHEVQDAGLISYGVIGKVWSALGLSTTVISKRQEEGLKTHKARSFPGVSGHYVGCL